MYVYIYIYVYKYIHIHIHTYAYVYTHIHTHTHLYIYIYYLFSIYLFISVVHSRVALYTRLFRFKVFFKSRCRLIGDARVEWNVYIVRRANCQCMYIYIYISVYTYVYRCHEILRAGRADAFLVIVQEKAMPSNIHKYKHTLRGVCVHMWHIASKWWMWTCLRWFGTMHVWRMKEPPCARALLHIVCMCVYIIRLRHVLVCALLADDGRRGAKADVTKIKLAVSPFCP